VPGVRSPVVAKLKGIYRSGRLTAFLEGKGRWTEKRFMTGYLGAWLVHAWATP
jgi:hypothetical protein